MRWSILIFTAACASNPFRPDPPFHSQAPFAVATDAELAAPATEPNAPEQLDKAAIVAGMSKVKPEVARCFDQYRTPGMASVAFTILRSGRPANVAVQGDFAAAPTGDCVARAVADKASFPQYTGPLKQLTYPFIFR